jgi:hypothetical protein
MSKPAASIKHGPCPHDGGIGTKNDVIRELLLKEGGTTEAEVLAAVGWKSVSMPRAARSLGLELRKCKANGRVTRYTGVPIRLSGLNGEAKAAKFINRGKAGEQETPAKQPGRYGGQFPHFLYPGRTHPASRLSRRHPPQASAIEIYGGDVPADRRPLPKRLRRPRNVEAVWRSPQNHLSRPSPLLP